MAWLAETKYIEVNFKLILGSLSRTFFIQTVQRRCANCVFEFDPTNRGVGWLVGWLGPNMGIL